MAGLSAAVVTFANAGSALHDMAKRTGVSASELSELGYAARQTGADLDKVETGLKGLANALFAAKNGSKEVIEAFHAIGLSVADLAGKPPGKQFDMVAKGLNHIGSASKRSALAQKLLGKSGRDLIPMFEELDALRKKARSDGLIPTEEAVEKADELGDTIDHLKESIHAATFNIGSSLAGTATEVVRVATRLVGQISKWASENEILAQTLTIVGVSLVAVGTALFSFGTFAYYAGHALTAIGTILGVVGSALGFLVSPIGIITAALVAGIVVWAKYTESGKAATASITAGLTELLGIAQGTFTGIADAVMAGEIELAGKIAMAGLKATMLTIAEEISAGIGGEMGNMVGAIAAKLAAGDIEGAWSTLVSKLHLMWVSMIEDVKATLTGIATKIREVHAEFSKLVSDAILEGAAEGHAIPNLLLAGTGGGLSAKEQFDRGKRLDEEGRKQGIENEAGGLADAQQAARDQIDRRTAGFKAKMDEINAKAKERTEAARTEFNNKTGADGNVGISAVSIAADQARDELNRLREEAARKRKAAEDQDEEDQEQIPQGGADAARADLAGTFSAAALAAMGAGGTDKVEKNTREIVKEMVKQNKLIEAQARRGGLGWLLR